MKHINKNYLASECGLIWSLKSDRFLKGTIQSNGYKTVSIFGVTKYVHRLIMESFRPIADMDSLEVNHKNGIKTDNRLSNLEWVTPQKNSEHSVRTGLNPVRSQDEDTIHKICKYLEDGWRNKDIAEIMGVSHGYVASVRRGDTAKYISCEYCFDVSRNNKLSPETVVRICEEIAKGGRAVDVAKICGVDANCVRNIKSRRIHKHISSSFDW